MLRPIRASVSFESSLSSIPVTMQVISFKGDTSDSKIKKHMIASCISIFKHDVNVEC